MAEFTLNNGIILSPQVLKFLFVYFVVCWVFVVACWLSSYGALVTVHGLLIAMASLAAQHRFWGFSSCSSQA